MRIVTVLLAGAIAIAGCGSGHNHVNAGDSVATREAVERRLEESTTTVAPPDTSAPVAPAVWTGHTIGSTTSPLTLTAETVTELYSTYGPIRFSLDEISEGDIIVMQTACDLLAGAVDDMQVVLVRDSFEEWFDGQLIAAGAPPEYIDAWDLRGMLISLVEMGCTPPSASPEPIDLG